MKTFIQQLFTVVFVLLASSSMNAQTEPLVLSYEDALAQAKNSDKILVIQFAGSDWCAPCIKLEKEIVETAIFQSFAEQFVWLKADFPRKKSNQLSPKELQRNEELAERFNKRGSFPLLVFIDSNGHILGQTPYKALTPEAYIEMIRTIIE